MDTDAMLLRNNISQEQADKSISTVDIKVIRAKVLCKCPIVMYEFEFIRRITQKEITKLVSDARTFFLGDYSMPMLNAIGREVCCCQGDELLGEYYEFISRPDSDTATPFYKLTLYKNRNGADLLTYVSTITTRYFRRIQMKKAAEKEQMVSIDEGNRLAITFSGNEVIENVWFELLLSEGQENGQSLAMERLHQALDRLPYREQLIIKLTVMDDASGLEAFEELKDYLNPEIPLSTWDTKQKQNAMALLKARALLHLKKILSV